MLERLHKIDLHNITQRRKTKPVTPGALVTLSSHAVKYINTVDWDREIGLGLVVSVNDKSAIVWWHLIPGAKHEVLEL